SPGQGDRGDDRQQWDEHEREDRVALGLSAWFRLVLGGRLTLACGPLRLGDREFGSSGHVCRTPSIAGPFRSVDTSDERGNAPRDAPTYSYVTVTYDAVGLARPHPKGLCWVLHRRVCRRHTCSGPG